MNNRNELNGRILEAFPKNLLENYFEVSGKKEELINKIPQTFTEKEIHKFICDSFNFLHLTINIFEINNTIPSSFSKIMDGECLYYDSSARVKEWIYLHKIFIKYYDTKLGQTDLIEFLLPVRIYNKGKILIVYQNTFQRDINSYFKHSIYLDRGARSVGVVDNIKYNFNKPLFSLDLNKGIKYLWKNDFIDAMKVRSRESKSIRQDRMDEDYLYKASYPKKWDELMTTPIQQTKFKSLSKTITLDHFDCNPSTGNIGLSFHPSSTNDIVDLVKLILKHNK